MLNRQSRIIIIISNLSSDRSKASSKRFLHMVWSRASSFNWQSPLLSLRSSSSFLRLLPRLLVTSICPFIFPSITCCRRQFLCNIKKYATYFKCVKYFILFISLLSSFSFILTLILLTWRIWWAPNNASKWQMGFSSEFNPYPANVENMVSS